MENANYKKDAITVVCLALILLSSLAIIACLVSILRNNFNGNTSSPTADSTATSQAADKKQASENSDAKTEKQQNNDNGTPTG